MFFVVMVCAGQLQQNGWYNPRAGGIISDIFYFGNCLTNLEHYNGQDTNWYSVFPVDWDSLDETMDGEVLKPEAKFWVVRGEKVELCLDRQEYWNADIELKEYEPGEVSAEEAGRFLVTSTAIYSGRQMKNFINQYRQTSIRYLSLTNGTTEITWKFGSHQSMMTIFGTRMSLKKKIITL
jgi:hypothetical protein